MAAKHAPLPISRLSHRIRSRSSVATAPSEGLRVRLLRAIVCSTLRILSYAASKFERDWEFNPAEGKYVFSRRHTISTSPTATRQTPRQTTRSPKVEKSISPRQRHVNGERLREILDNGRPRIAPGTYSINGATHEKDLYTPNASPRFIDSKSRHAPLDVAHIPRLAPPADIVSGALNNPRRRPNPNHEASNGPLYSTSSPNKRPILTHQSSTSSSLDDLASSASLLPGTPLQPQFPQLSSTPLNNPHPLAKQRTPSQNALMEQDAIETLLFMSSPENSGYFPGSQQHPRPPIPRSANITPLLSAFGSESASTGSVMETDHDAGRRAAIQRTTLVNNGTNGGAYGCYAHSRIPSGAGLEHEAGDEIDRMLDEMVDSDEELGFKWLPASTNQANTSSLQPNVAGSGTLS
ncbi:predicted protein [Uncinocarpus reesii 1704]|uniref:Uncharacterized protein n=1 Tax=Uncinocarpus reesii (strain UAMH 1704) TaxID=336963 RepID=C4JVD3_UNCRE|nr:uncharacterized protein UREG_06525 [Uncinocarpus reesii 1704]EEP81660.1 predicted protein [Uncinocarpus reesii 1704]